MADAAHTASSLAHAFPAAEVWACDGILNNRAVFCSKARITFALGVDTVAMPTTVTRTCIGKHYAAISTLKTNVADTSLTLHVTRPVAHAIVGANAIHSSAAIISRESLIANAFLVDT